MSIKDRLADKASTPGDYPDSIKWENEGDEVAGVVQKKRLYHGEHGDVVVIEVDDEDDGLVSVFLGSTNLHRGLVEGEADTPSGVSLGRAVLPGDEVYIRYDGKSRTSKGFQVNNFAMVVAPGEGVEEADAEQPEAQADQDTDAEGVPF